MRWWHVELFTGGTRLFQAQGVREALQVVNAYGGGTFHLDSR